jgi:parallel beta-helix repeat protein
MNATMRSVTLCCLMLAGVSAHAAAIFPKVINTNNSGSGSLRAAITAANANGKGGAIISFQIGSSCGPHVIHLATALPDITAETHIEGYSQSGSSKNSMDATSGNNAAICIVLDGGNTVDDAFTVPASVADSMEISVQGIAFGGFTHSAVNLRGGSHHAVSGIRTGGTMSGVHLASNSYGVILAAGVHDTTVGGDDVSDVNQFGDITHNAIYLGAAAGNTLRYDNVGFVFDAHQNRVILPTGGAGIAVGGYRNTLLDLDLENAGAAGVHLSNQAAYENDVYGSVFSNNTGDGVLIDDDAGANSILLNDISDNGGAGVRVINGQGNRIERNEISGNAGIGIDLAGEGPTPNDNDSQQPAPDYANIGLNSPVLTSAGGGMFSGTVSGTLTTVPGTYYIDVYESFSCGASGPADSIWTPVSGTQTGTVIVSAPLVQGQGSTSFTLPIAFSSFLDPLPISITATASDTFGNTSEFSACVQYFQSSVTNR